MKNPLGLNQAEIIASLAIELVKSSKKVISPITKQPFRVKIGSDNPPSSFVSFLLRCCRIPFGLSRGRHCGRHEFSILSLRRYDQYGKHLSGLGGVHSRSHRLGEPNNNNRRSKYDIRLELINAISDCVAWPSPCERYIVRTAQGLALLRYSIQRSNGTESK